jgi:riboflavin biosynthesis pyrimidine reductase
MRMVYPTVGPDIDPTSFHGLGQAGDTSNVESPDGSGDAYWRAAASVDDLYPWPDGLWVRANMVSTLDGRAQGTEGLTASISHPSDKFIFGRLRATCDVVLVGAGTARAEHYRPARTRDRDASARADRGQHPAPVIALVSRSLTFDLTSALFTEAEQDRSIQRPIIITAADSDPEQRRALSKVATVVVAGTTHVDLSLAFDHLVGAGYSRILCEGGPSLLGDLVAGNHLNELDLTMSPQLIGAGMSILEPTRAPEVAARTRTETAGPWPFELAHIVEADSMLMLRYTATTPTAIG